MTRWPLRLSPAKERTPDGGGLWLLRLNHSIVPAHDKEASFPNWWLRGRGLGDACVGTRRGRVPNDHKLGEVKLENR